MKNSNTVVIVFTILFISNCVNAQISGSMAPNMAVPSPAEPSKASAGQFTGNVNTYSGSYQNNVNLGVVSTPGGLSYSVDLTYNSKNFVSNTPDHVDGIPYGEGWNISLPSITVKTIARSPELPGKGNSSTWKYKTENYSSIDLVDEGEVYYYQPYLSIPGKASGNLILKHQTNNRSIFVLEKFEKYVQAEFFNGIWEVILEDGTVFRFDMIRNNIRNAPNNRLDRIRERLEFVPDTYTIVFDSITSDPDTIYARDTETIYREYCDTWDPVTYNCLNTSYDTFTYRKAYKSVTDDSVDIDINLAQSLKPVVERTAWFPSEMYNPAKNHQRIFFLYETHGKINFHNEYLQNNFQNFFLGYIMDSVYTNFSRSSDSLYQLFGGGGSNGNNYFCSCPNAHGLPDLSGSLPYFKSYKDYGQSNKIFNKNKPHRAGTIYREIFLKTVIAADFSNGYTPIEKLELEYASFDVNEYAQNNSSFDLTKANLLLWKNDPLVIRFDSLYSSKAIYHRGIVSDTNFLPVSFSSDMSWKTNSVGQHWTRYRHLRSNQFLMKNHGVTVGINKNKNIFDYWDNLNTDANATDILSRNPYAANIHGYSSSPFYVGREKITSSSSYLPFDHSFLESERLSLDFVQGDVYEIRSLIHQPFVQGHFKTVNYDLDIVTGEAPSSSNSYYESDPRNTANALVDIGSDQLPAEALNFPGKNYSIWNTFGNIVKWASGWNVNTDGKTYISSNFVLPNLPSDYEGFHVRIGPATSDQYNNFGLYKSERDELNDDDPNSLSSLLGGFNSYSSYYSLYRKQKLGQSAISIVPSNVFNKSILVHDNQYDDGHQRLWDTDPIPQNFGNGMPWVMMDGAQVAGMSKTRFETYAKKDYDHHRFWWNNFPDAPYTNSNNDPTSNFPNKPTLADQNVKLKAFQINRISKNPYVLKSAKFYKLSDYYDYLAEYTGDTTIWNDNLVQQIDLDFDILQSTIPENKFLIQNLNRSYPDGSQYYRNIFVLKEVRNVDISNKSNYIATQFEYSLIHSINSNFRNSIFSGNPNSTGSKTVRLGNIVLLSKIIDQLGGETSIEFSSNYINTNPTFSWSWLGSRVDPSNLNASNSYLQFLPPNINQEVTYPVSRIGKRDEYGNWQFTDYIFEEPTYDGGLFSGFALGYFVINKNAPIEMGSLSGFAKTTKLFPPLDPSNPGQRAKVVFEHYAINNETITLYNIPENHPYLLLGKVKEKREYDDQNNLVRKYLYHYKATRAYLNYSKRKRITIPYLTWDVLYNTGHCGTAYERQGLIQYEPGRTSSFFGDYLDLNVAPWMKNDNDYFLWSEFKPLDKDVADFKVTPFDNQKFAPNYFGPGPDSYFIRLIKEEAFDYYPLESEPSNNSSQNRTLNYGSHTASMHSATKYFYFSANDKGWTNNAQYKKLLGKGNPNDTSEWIALSDEKKFWDEFEDQNPNPLNLNGASGHFRRNKSYEPSWKLSATKIYSNNVPDAYQVNEKYYLFDLSKLYRYKEFWGGTECPNGYNIFTTEGFNHKIRDEAYNVKFASDYSVRDAVFQTISYSYKDGFDPTRVYEFYEYDDYKSGVISLDTDDVDTIYRSINPLFCDVLDPDPFPGNSPAIFRNNLFNLQPKSNRSEVIINSQFEELKKAGLWEEYLIKEKGISPKELHSKTEVLDNVFQNVSVLKGAYISYDTIKIFNNHTYSDHSSIINDEEFLFYEWGQVNDSVARTKILNDENGNIIGFYDSMIAVSYNAYIMKLPYKNIQYTEIFARNRFGQAMAAKDQKGLVTNLTFPSRSYTWIIDQNQYVKRLMWIGDPANNQYYFDSVFCAYRVLNFGKFGVPTSHTVGFGRNDSLHTKIEYDKYYNVSKVTDPNQLITEYSYDGFNRIVESKVNNILRDTYAYSYWNMPNNMLPSDDFWQRTDFNYSEHLSYNDANIATITRSHVDPLGRAIHTGINGIDVNSGTLLRNTIHSGSIDFDLWQRPVSAYKPFVGINSSLNLEVDKSGIFNRIEKENSPRGLNIESADFGESISGSHTIENEYSIISRNRLQWELDIVNSELNKICAAGATIMKTVFDDQDGKRSYTYTNGLGQKIADAVKLDSINKIVTLYVYDSNGKLYKSINDKRQVRVYYYNNLGFLYKNTDPDAGTTMTWYDNTGSPRYIQDPNMRAKGNNGWIREFEYDIYGNLIKQSKTELNTTINTNATHTSDEHAYAWLNEGSTINKTGPILKEKTFEYGKPQIAKGYVRDEIYDEYLCGYYGIGKLTNSESYDHTGELVESNFQFYSKDGNLRSYCSQFNPNGITPVKAGILNRIYYDYDIQGRLKNKKIDLGGDDVQDFYLKYTYDELGRMSTVLGGLKGSLDSSQVLIAYDYYDRYGLVKNKNYYFSNGNSYTTLIDSIFYSYEGKRQRLKGISSDFMDYRLYYDNDTIAYTQHVVLPSGSPAYNPSEYLTNSENYNGNINAIKCSYLNPSFNEITHYGYHYDNANRLDHADAFIVRDVDPTVQIHPKMWAPTGNSLFSIGDVNYTYDDIGNIINRSRGEYPAQQNNAVYFNNFTAGYSSINNKLVNVNGQNKAYIYDANGNVIDDNIKSQTMNYDRANLPYEFNKSGQSTEYLYNSSDNRIYKSYGQNAAQSREYYFKDASNAVVAIFNEFDGSWKHYLYADDKFASFKPNRDQMPDFVGYDFVANRALENQGSIIMTQNDIIVNNQNVSNYANGDSLIIAGGKVTTQNLNRNTSLEIKGESVVLSNSTSFSPEFGERIRMSTIKIVYRNCVTPSSILTNYDNDSINKLKYYEYDHLKNTRLAFVHTFSSGTGSTNLTNAIDYYPFGKILREYNLENEKFKFTGKERDDESGYDYFEARLYDSDFGRFLQVDPLGGKYPEFSPYNYTLNNPIGLIDKDGREPGDPLTEMQVRDNRASNLNGRIRNNGTSVHQGFDLHANEGTNILAVKKSQVFKVVCDESKGGAYGIQLILEYSNLEGEKRFAQYAHLADVYVEEGDNVEEGQVVGITGVTGNASSNSPHLHFELRDSKSPGIGSKNRLDPNEVLDTKFSSQNERGNQTLTGVIKTEKDGTQYKNNLDGTTKLYSVPNPPPVSSEIDGIN